MTEPLEEIIPSKTGRKRRHESTVVTYGPRKGAVPVGQYDRLSLAKKTEQAQAMALSRMDTTEAVEAEGVAYVYRRYTDPDHSGSKRNQERPAFDLMVADLDAGIIGGLAVSNIDRLTRRHGILEQLIERYETNEEQARKGKAERLYWYSNDPLVDLRTEDGRREARKRVDAGYEEARAIARRQTGRHDQYRRLGIMVGSRGYGHRTDGSVVEPEAAVIRRLADIIDSGQKISPILPELERDGIVSTHGKPFTLRTVKSVLTSARLVGYRVDTTAPDGIARDEKGEPIKGNQEPILSLEQFLRVRDVFAGRARGEEFRKYLGSAIFICDTCGYVMGAGWLKRDDRHRYLCSHQKPGRCGKNQLHGPKADDFLRLAVELELAKDQPTVVAQEPWPGEGQLASVEAKRALARERKEAGAIDVEVWLDQDMALAEVIGGLRKSRRAWLADHPVPTAPASESLLERWQSGDLDRQRSVVHELLKGVLVAPGPFSADRLRAIPRNG
jgi:site-specific DNA recombinase